jgi:hypothetical protein
VAAGDTLLIFTPHQNDAPASNYATFDTRNGVLVLAFDQTTAEAAVFRGILPRHYTGRGVTVYLHFCTASATSGNAGWDVAFARLGDGSQNLASFSYATAQTVTAVAVPGTTGLPKIVSVAVSNGTNMNSVAVGESFLLRVRRDTSVGTNATGDLQLIAVEIREQ